jgi:YidC/Oxa1 family membrane protein insertase
MPIFIALYKVLLLSIEMRHQPFVHCGSSDLSSPDPLTPINLFGYAAVRSSVDAASGSVRDRCSVVTMFLQMKMSPQQMDPAQQQVMMFMPWLMMLFFAPLAAGLQLYYVAEQSAQPRAAALALFTHARDEMTESLIRTNAASRRAS